jgi:hypothetical protein
VIDAYQVPAVSARIWPGIAPDSRGVFILGGWRTAGYIE